MTVREIINSNKDKYTEYEVYEFTCGHKIHTDYIQNLDGVAPESDYMDRECVRWELMCQDEYNETILANGSVSADFADWFGDENATILVCFVNPIR